MDNNELQQNLQQNLKNWMSRNNPNMTYGDILNMSNKGVDDQLRQSYLNHDEDDMRQSFIDSDRQRLQKLD